MRELVGRVLTGIFQTSWSGGEVLIQELGEAFYCDVILEIDHKDRFLLEHNRIGAWSGKEKLLKVNPKEHHIEGDLSFLESRIHRIAPDEHEIVTVYLENGIQISAYVEYGTRLDVRRNAIKRSD